MAEEATTPAGEVQAPQTEQTPTTNANQPAETPQAPVNAPKVPDLHGFTEEQLADMAKFYAANGGYDKVKSRLSNPQQNQSEEAKQSQTQEQAQPQVQQPTNTNQPPKGYASLQELSVERYFKDLAAEPKYKNISEQIANGEILKEMSRMGMSPVDNNYNINVDQINQFLALKSASVPTAPTPAEVTTTPTVDYIQIDGDIKDMNQALAVYQQSMDAQKKGLPTHPSFQQAKEFINKNWGSAKK